MIGGKTADQDDEDDLLSVKIKISPLVSLSPEAFFLRTRLRLQSCRAKPLSQSHVSPVYFSAFFFLLPLPSSSHFTVAFLSGVPLS